jgi:hypothetical protein
MPSSVAAVGFLGPIVARIAAETLRPVLSAISPVGPACTGATRTGGSDGTRTRDLRCDRPIRIQGHPVTIGFDLAHLQAFSALPVRLWRMVA